MIIVPASSPVSDADGDAVGAGEAVADTGVGAGSEAEAGWGATSVRERMAAAAAVSRRSQVRDVKVASFLLRGWPGPRVWAGAPPPSLAAGERGHREAV